MSERNPLILIVDDDENLVDMIARLMKREGFKTVSANDGDGALRIVSSDKPDLMLLDIKMGEMDGMEVLRQAKELDPELSIIILTGYHDTHGAVSAIKAGAYDYFSKPFESNELIRAVHQALAEKRLQRNVKDLSSRLHEGHSLNEVMGPSDAVTRIISEVNRVAESDFTVVIAGETGSGERTDRPGHPRGELAAPKPRSSPSIAAPSLRRSSKANCSDTKKDPSQGRTSKKPANLNWPRGGPCFSMRSRTCPWGLRQSCSGSSRRRRSTGWAGRNRSASMSGFSWRATRIFTN